MLLSSQQYKNYVVSGKKMNDACLKGERKKTNQPSGKKRKRKEKRGGCLLIEGLEYLKLTKMAFLFVHVHTALCV